MQAKVKAVRRGFCNFSLGVETKRDGQYTYYRPVTDFRGIPLAFRTKYAAEFAAKLMNKEVVLA